MMRSLLLLGILLGLLPVGPAGAQDPTPVPDEAERAELQAKLNAKLEKTFVESGGWELDFQRAKARAAKERKHLFVYFTRTFAP